MARCNTCGQDEMAMGCGCAMVSILVIFCSVLVTILIMKS